MNHTKKRKTLLSYYTKEIPKVAGCESQPHEPDDDSQVHDDNNETIAQHHDDETHEVPSQIPSSQPCHTSHASIERDPELRKPIDSYSEGKQDEIVREYIIHGPYRFGSLMTQYPSTGPLDHQRRFQYSWFKKFPWLEYSPTRDAAYCFPCFLFAKKPLGKAGSDVFSVGGFRSWKRVGGKNCAFLSHLGHDCNSSHSFAALSWENLKLTKGHIKNVYEKQTPLQIAKNRLRLKTSIEVIRWLTFQKCALRGHDESDTSNNQGNFLEMLKLVASYSTDVDATVLKNAPQNAIYSCPSVQKEILHVFAQNVQDVIRKEIGDSKFCILVDESRDISKREQMAIVVRFVDVAGVVRERFLKLVHVKETTSLTLKGEIDSVLAHHNLSIHNLRGQGYDGASNMRGEWNGLQALFLKDCPYAYYVHCLAHQLQLALIAASREVAEVHDFFKDLNFIVNVVSASAKRHDELQSSQLAEIERLIEIEEIETGTGMNQIGSLQRPGDTRWSSHFKSISSLYSMFSATRSVLEKIAIDRRATYSQRGDANSALKKLLSFDFIFILHLMQEVMGFTDVLCRALQVKSQDILNAMHLVSTTKIVVQDLRDDGWGTLLHKVLTFCSKHDTQVPNMEALYSDIIRSRRNKDAITVEHHYRVDVFMAAVDQQLQELNNRFSEQSTELLTLSVALNPIDGYKHFDVASISTLAKKYYPEDFSELDICQLLYELQVFILDIGKSPSLKNLSCFGGLCQMLSETGKSTVYPMVDRIVRLI